MNLSTVRSLIKKKNRLSFLLVALFIAGGVLVASSSYLHFARENCGADPSDTLQKRKNAYNDSVYRVSMRAGDSYFAAKEYEKAISEFEKGLKARPKDPYATDKLSKAKAQLDAKIRANMDYVKSIASGDAYFKTKDYLNAKAYYQMAIDARPDDAYARDKLKETMDLLRSMKAVNILYDVAIANADKLFQQKEYEKAMAEFENASKILPDEKYPKDRINEIIKIMIDLQTKEEMYAQSITAADKAYTSKSFQVALLEYQKASGYKPEEQYPKDRIKELTALLAEMKVRDEAYRKAIAIADKFFDDASYDPSKSEYQNASKIKPQEQYPVKRIKEIDAILARLKNTKEEYNRLVNLADSFYVEKKYINAKATYQQALKIKPGEPYPKEMIAKADNLISGQEANSKLLEEAYLAALSEADKQFMAKDYGKAKAAYQNASGIKPDEQYPKDRIREIEGIFALAEKQKQLDKQYADILAGADKLLADKSYEAAKPEYQKALQLKPEEKYPKDRIAEIDLALGDVAKQKALNDQYNALLAKADQSFAAGTWALAKTDYTAASGMKPNEAYPKEKLAEIEKILSGIAEKKALDEKYAGTIAGADKFFAAKSYPEARTEYVKAGEMKPAEAYPKSRIEDIDKILAAIEAQKSKEEQYKGLIEKADKLLADKSWEPAKTEYQNASALKPAEAYPKGKIAEINGILAVIAKQKALDDQYAAFIANADTLLSNKSYAQAKIQYQSALRLKPDEKYPKDRISEIDIALADLAKQKALDDQYAAAVSKADRSFAAKSWEPAKNDYAAASALKPNEAYPKNKIEEIEKILAGIAEQKALDEKYAGIIAGADKLLLAKSYPEARAEYTKAGELKPAEVYPKTKIAEIDKIVAAIEAAKSLDEQYKGSIEKADKLLADKSWEPAKTEYQNASALKPAEAYPKGKIAEINAVLAAIAKQKALDDQYAALISNADSLLNQKSYGLSKTQYQSALKLKPEEKYPKDRIAEIDIAMADLAKQKALDDQYTAAVAKADKAFAARTWEQAKADYAAASAVKPNEAYPKDKIAEIETILKGIAEQKALDEKYAGVIAGADKLLASKSYPLARAEYVKAGDLKPAEAYPKTKIEEIDKVLAAIEAQKTLDEQYRGFIAKGDKLLAEKSWEPAKAEYMNAAALKPAEAYPKGKIAEIDKVLEEIARKKALDDQYAAAIASGDKLLAEKSFEASKLQYLAASALKPTELYPREKINEIDKAVAEIARLKAIDDQYAEAISRADKLFSDKFWENAKIEYVNAGKIKPNEQYPKEKILEIQKALDEIARQKVIDMKYQSTIANADRLLEAKTFEQAKAAYLDAAGLKPAEQYPKEKMAFIEKIMAEQAHQREVEMQYKASVTKADQLLLSKSYESAKAEFVNAASLKPDEQYPKTKIAAIEKVLADQKAFEDKYNGAIATGDTAFARKSWEQAKAAFQMALQMKPQEQYPKDRIAEIDKTVALLAKQKVIDDQYNASVAKADKLFGDKSYALARTEYLNSGTIKPNEQYPKDKVAEIDGIVAEIKAKDEAYKASIAKANQLLAQKSYEDARSEYQNAGEIKPAEQYPKDKIAEINKILMELKGKRQTFDELVSKGNDQLSVKDFYKAKDYFQQALSIFPEEQYPKERLIRINSVIDSIFRANKVFYDKAVADGDRYYNSMTFDQAIESFQEALNFLPMEQYPKEMINKIKKTIAENAIVDVVNSAQIVGNGVEKQFGFEPVNIISRKNNYIYIKIRNLSNRPFSVMLRYGKDKQINGGAVIKNVSGDGKVNERLISVREQDPWYRNDNNWISLYPQGGDVEVTFIQISRAGQ